MTVKNLIKMNEAWENGTYLFFHEDEGSKQKMYSEKVADILQGVAYHDVGGRQVESFDFESVYLK